jgi:hypothetical protein
VGHGPARELSGGESKVVELNPELSSKLDTALERLDRLNAKFKAARDEERFAQSSKAWNRVCGEIDGYLRSVAKALIESHQLNLDIGSEGGGVKAKPYLEEMTQVFERLYFRLDGDQAIASFGTRTVATTRIKELDYAWVEKAVVDWVVMSVEGKR